MPELCAPGKHRRRSRHRVYSVKIFAVILLAIQLLRFSYAQGTIEFRNDFISNAQTGELYEAPVFTADGLPVSANFSAGLYLLRAGSESLIAVTSFRDTRPGRLNPIDVSVPGIPGGEQAAFRLKVWETAAGSYENALLSGRCAGIFPTVEPGNQVTVVLGPAVQSDIGLIPTLDGLLPLTLDCIPEPRTVAFFLLGAIFLMRKTKAKM
jgi:hypothetical protein